MHAVPERIGWALKLLQPGPAERILEIGCGSGVAAGLVCGQLVGGRLLALDRSPTAIERTRARNAAHLQEGRLETYAGELRHLSVPPGSVDAAFAVDVNVFWTTAADAELAVLSAALRPGGRLHLLYGAGPTGRERITEAVAAAVTAHRFADLVVHDRGVGCGVSACRP